MTDAKRCCHCHAYKPVTAFARAAAYRDGLARRCKMCQRGYDQARAARAYTDPPTPPESKQCARCARELPAAAFSRNIQHTVGLQSYCRSCASDYHQERNERLDRERDEEQP